MSGRSNHVWGGVVFIATCIFISVVIYLAVTRGRVDDRAGESADELANQLQAEAGPMPDIAPMPSQADASKESTLKREAGADMGSCHSGSCSWSKTLTETVVRSDEGQRLIELDLLGGTSSDTDNGPIKWDAASHRVWVFCSTRLPATVMRVDNGWQVDVLDFIEGVPTILDSSAAIYRRTCYANPDDLANNAERLGYHLIPESWQELNITEPADMFAKAAEASENLEFLTEGLE